MSGSGSSGSVAAVPETGTWVLGFLAPGTVFFMVRRNAETSMQSEDPDRA